MKAEVHDKSNRISNRINPLRIRNASTYNPFRESEPPQHAIPITEESSSPSSSSFKDNHENPKDGTVETIEALTVEQGSSSANQNELEHLENSPIDKNAAPEQVIENSVPSENENVHDKNDEDVSSITDKLEHNSISTISSQRRKSTNPFNDNFNDENPHNSTTITPAATTAADEEQYYQNSVKSKKSSNPFDDDFDDQNSHTSSTAPPALSTVATDERHCQTSVVSKKSSNPFDDDFDDANDDDERGSIQSTISTLSSPTIRTAHTTGTALSDITKESLPNPPAKPVKRVSALAIAAQATTLPAMSPDREKYLKSTKHPPDVEK